MAPRSPLWRRQEAQVIRTILIAVIASITLTAAAQDAPRYFIERIEVRNAGRVSPDVILAESRLRADREYSEVELREASHRINRLPFILTADFSLEKGSERGRHVLVLTVAETKPFFFHIDSRFYLEEGDNAVHSYRDSLTPSGDDLALGFRWFVGRRGAIHLGLQGENEDTLQHTSDDASLAIGYTQYDIFGSRAFATINIKKPISIDGGQISPQVVVGVPLSPNQTLTVSFDQTQFEREALRVDGVRYPRHSEQDVLRVRWSFNTTNDPFFPTQGTLLAVGPVVSRSDNTATSVRLLGNGATEVHIFRNRYDAFGLEAHAARYWELSDRNSVGAAIEGGWSSLDGDRTAEGLPTERFDGDESSIAVQGGFSRSLWSAERRAGGGDSRVVASLRWVTEDSVNEFREDENLAQLTASWVRRSSWGTVRLGVGYAW
jgi:outer membrane protein assembly factor BamA